MSNQPFTVTEFVVTLLGDASVGMDDMTTVFELPAETEMSRDEMEEACEELQALVRKWFGGEKVYVTTPNFQAMEALSEEESLAELAAVEELEELGELRMSNITFTFTKSELEELLDKTLREFVAYRRLYGDDTDCAISNTVAGAVQEIELNSAFAQFGGREEFDAQVAEFQAFMDEEMAA